MKLLSGLVFGVFIWFSTPVYALQANKSYNTDFIGTWKGTANTLQFCKNDKQDKNGREKISITIETPDIKPGQNYTVILKAKWPCFAESKTSGFIFADEYWGADDDRLKFIRLKQEKDNTLSGSIRMDLNGSTLKMDFEDFKK